MPDDHHGLPIAVLATTAIAPITWGSTYAVTTEMLPPDRPLLAGALRALPAGLLLFAATRRVPRGEWWWKAAALGTLNIGLFFALLFVAAERLHGGVASTIGSVQPLVAATLASLVLAEPLRRAVVLAGALGVVGVAMLVLQPGAHLDALGVVAALAGAVSMAAGVTLTKKWRPEAPLLAFTSWQLLVGGTLLAVVGAVVEGPPPDLTARNVDGFVWLTLAGTAAAYSLWFRGIGKLPVANVTLLSLLTPVVAVTIGYLVLHDDLGRWQLAGIALVMTALWLGQRQAGAQGVIHGVAGQPSAAAISGNAVAPSTDSRTMSA